MPMRLLTLSAVPAVLLWILAPVAVDAAEAKPSPYVLSVDALTSEPLGHHPVVVVHEGRELRFASQKNVDAFKADPAKALKAIDAKLIADQTPLYPMTTCPVSGEKLGGMGAPADYLHGNELVRFCCSGCTDEFKKDPEKAMAKVHAAVIAAQKSTYPMTRCAVSGDKLGGDMGEPIDKVYATRLVRFCCDSCESEFLKDPAKTTAALDHARAGGKATETKPSGGHDHHTHEGH